MQDKGKGLSKIVVVSAVTATVVFLFLVGTLAGVYFLICCEPIAKPRPGERRDDRPGQERATLTDAAKIASVSFQSWGHAGPLYPGPNEPPGYVFSDSVELRQDLSAKRSTKKDYDRDLPDESSSFSAQLTADQMAKLLNTCVKNDIINQPDSKEVRSEGGTTLVIEYDGEKRSIVTSNIGVNTKEVAEVLGVIEQLKGSLRWTPSSPQ